MPDLVQFHSKNINTSSFFYFQYIYQIISINYSHAFIFGGVCTCTSLRWNMSSVQNSASCKAINKKHIFVLIIKCNTSFLSSRIDKDISLVAILKKHGRKITLRFKSCNHFYNPNRDPRNLIDSNRSGYDTHFLRACYYYKNATE